MLYISSTCFKNLKINEIFSFLKKNKLQNLELSYLPFEPNLKKKLNLNKNMFNYIIHNYFPPQKKNFVFNLASLDNEISKLSLNMAINNIYLSKSLGSKIMSIHAGFLVDIKLNELGKNIINKNFFDRNKSIDRFLENYYFINQIAKKIILNY